MKAAVRAAELIGDLFADAYGDAVGGEVDSDVEGVEFAGACLLLRAVCADECGVFARAGSRDDFGRGV